MFPLFGLLIFGGSLGAAQLFKKPAAGHSPNVASPDAHAPYEPVPDILVEAASEADRLDVDHYITVSAGALGLATVGHIVFPPARSPESPRSWLCIASVASRRL